MKCGLTIAVAILSLLAVTAAKALSDGPVPTDRPFAEGLDLDAIQRRLDELKARKAVEQTAPNPTHQMFAAIEANMVTIPAGRFAMGSPPNENGRYDDEGPQHMVTVRSFLMSKYAVTRDEFSQFVTETGHDTTGGCFGDAGTELKLDPARSWRSPGFQQSGLDPVVCVSWNDANAYARWLTGKTGHEYRLPTEAEWEYAARAGTTTAWFWGNDQASQCTYANGADQTALKSFPNWTVVPCSDGYIYTAPVGSFMANRWGLYDMLGNAWQWTQDCYNSNYDDAPADGQAWTAGDCNQRVLRGGSWNFIPRILRAANRAKRSTGSRHYSAGFRLSRTVP